MHEAGLARTALEIACKVARDRNATRIHRLVIRVGDLSGVVPDALQFALEALSPDTPAERAVFEIEVVPVVCHCVACGRDFRPTDVIYICPECGAISSDIREGHELALHAMEVS